MKLLIAATGGFTLSVVYCASTAKIKSLINRENSEQLTGILIPYGTELEG